MVALGLPIVALLVAGIYVTAALAWASHTFACDFGSYHAAARRFLDGASAYDMTVQATGSCGTYYYPPPFTLFVVPFTFAGSFTTAAWVWIVGLLAAFGAGVALLPVRREIRWAIVLLAGIEWPFLFGLRIGEVGPLLFLAFAAGWRWRDEARPLGAAAALGALTKVQPGILFVWMLLTRRWRALAVAVVLAAAFGGFAALVMGPGAWTDFLTLIRRASSATTIPHNLTPGATAYFLGVPESVSVGIQWLSTAFVLCVVAVAALRATGEASYLVAVVASQLISPILWDHYAFLLLLPVAWLLNRGHWWALLVPLSQAWVLVAITPPIAYLAAFYAMLLAPLLLGRRSAASSVPGQTVSPVTAQMG